jgi:hypothetical protein
VLSVSRCRAITEPPGAADLIDLAIRLYEQGRYRDAHELLDRAGAILLRQEDAGLLARVDETRARVFLAERKYREARRVIDRAVETLERGGEVAALAGALTTRGVVLARLGDSEGSAMRSHAGRLAECPGCGRSHATPGDFSNKVKSVRGAYNPPRLPFAGGGVHLAPARLSCPISLTPYPGGRIVPSFPLSSAKSSTSSVSRPLTKLWRSQ